jgi:hypothetical protein
MGCQKFTLRSSITWQDRHLFKSSGVRSVQDQNVQGLGAVTGEGLGEEPRVLGHEIDDLMTLIPASDAERGRNHPKGLSKTPPPAFHFGVAVVVNTWNVVMLIVHTSFHALRLIARASGASVFDSANAGTAFRGRSRTFGAARGVDRRQGVVRFSSSRVT